MQLPRQLNRAEPVCVEGGFGWGGKSCAAAQLFGAVRRFLSSDLTGLMPFRDRRSLSSASAVPRAGRMTRTPDRLAAVRATATPPPTAIPNCSARSSMCGKPVRLSPPCCPIRERVQGPEHPCTLITRGNLARWTGRRGMRPGPGTSTTRYYPSSDGYWAPSTRTAWLPAAASPPGRREQSRSAGVDD
jgi:hypothetical protein